MNAFRLNWLATVGALLTLPMEALAQPSFHHEQSIEAMVLNADTVVVGKIVAVAEGKEFHETTIDVEETLRGKHREQQRVRFPHRLWQLGVGGFDAAELNVVRKDASRLLVAMRGEPAKIFGLIPLKDQEMNVYRADLTVLRKPADVILAARDTIRRAPGVKRIDTFPLTIPIKGGYYGGLGGSTTVQALVDELLEKKALEYIRSDERWRRTEGASALRHFKSDENIARVKALLKDAEPYISSHAAENHGIEVRIYTVRKAAFDTLKDWGITVDQPVFKDTVTNLDAVRRIHLGGAEFTAAKLKDLNRFKNLQDLDLSAAELTDDNLRDLRSFEQLRTLNLEKTKLTDTSFTLLTELNSLRSLHLGYCNVNDSALKKLATLKNLEELWLANTEVTDAGLKELSGLKNLAMLGVPDTKVTAAGLKNLSACKNLTTLYLSNHQVTDETLQTLRQMGMLHVLSQASAKRRPNQPGYENSPRAKSAAEVYELDLWKSPVTDIGLKELTIFENLARLELADTRVTEAGVAQLRKALPKCTIRR